MHPAVRRRNRRGQKVQWRTSRRSMFPHRSFQRGPKLLRRRLPPFPAVSNNRRGRMNYGLLFGDSRQIIRSEWIFSLYGEVTPAITDYDADSSPNLALSKPMSFVPRFYHFSAVITPILPAEVYVPKIWTAACPFLTSGGPGCYRCLMASIANRYPAQTGLYIWKRWSAL